MNAFHSAGSSSPRLESSGRVAATSARVSFGSRSELASSSALVVASGFLTAAAVPRASAAEEEADRLRVFFEPLAVGDEDQLVVGRHAELVDRGDDRVLAAQAQVDALDVAEAAQHRLGAAADQRRQQPVADVDGVRRRRASAWRGRGSSSGRRPGRGCRRWRSSCRAGRRPPLRLISSARSARSAGGRRSRRRRPRRDPVRGPAAPRAHRRSPGRSVRRRPA